MKTSDFDYELPSELIAQHPIEPRDSSRLLVLHRDSGRLEHRSFRDIMAYLLPGDVLVFNDSRVIPARLKGKRAGGGAAEVMLLRRLDDNLWEALVRPGKKLRPGAVVEIEAGGAPLTAEIKEVLEGGIRTVTFSDESRLPLSGEMPLPPYIHAPLERPERYQTVYARVSGSVAAPTAGLHFTPELLEEIGKMGVDCRFVTLHVGLDTFRPVTEEDPRQHVIHREYGVLDGDTAAALAAAKKEGRRVICVGTTSVRLTEQAAVVSPDGQVRPFHDWAELFILPGHRFRVADAMITNFHLPRSSLMMLVSAFAGKGNIDKAYAEAIEKEYRFYSFGDAMLIL